MNASTTYARTPLVVSAGNLTAGPVQAMFRDGDRESLLHNYLVLVRRLRGQLREPTITLRNADISALAEHLGASEEAVLDDLLERMGATRAQRKALFAMFAVGALSIVATGSVALELSSADALADGSIGSTDTPAVVDFAESGAVTSLGEPAAASITTDGEAVAIDGSATVAPATTAGTTTSEAELAIAGAGDWEYERSLQQLADALSTRPSAPAVASSLEGVGVADDGSSVAVAPPPEPLGDGVGIADDGSTVAVGTPPVPAAEGIGVAEDGSVVGVAPPPVP